MIKYITGNIFSDEKIIMHGCNIGGGFGSGFAKEVAEHYPKVKYYYLEEYRNYELGEIQIVKISDVTIINAFTQRRFGPVELGPYVSYPAITECVKKACAHYGTFAMPKIGSGLGGGCWNIIESIINKVSGSQEIRIYSLINEIVKKDSCL